MTESVIGLVGDRKTAQQVRGELAKLGCADRTIAIFGEEDADNVVQELTERGHTLTVEYDVNDAITREAVALFEPDIVLAPFLKRAIPADVWQKRRCLIVHPGPIGDRGPSALDWAVLEGAPKWGVTVIEAVAEFDAGPVWASAHFPMRAGTKSSLYRREVTEAAVTAVLTALDRIEAGTFVPSRPAPCATTIRGRTRPPCRQADRAINWEIDATETVLRKIRSADGTPGVRDSLFGQPVRLFDAHPDLTGQLSGPPGAPVARSGGAIARATRDGAVWIGHVRTEQPLALKLPAAQVFAGEIAGLPERGGPCPIRYEERGTVGLLHFDFYNGAMSTAQCEALRRAYADARARPTRALVLLGGADYWSNGLHLGVIESADSPADESWRNINAIDDFARDVICTTDRLVIAVMRGNAGAGGVFLALAADEVWSCESVVLNPHYKDMGNLYGSEYWTYLLPRRVAADDVARVMSARLPMGAAAALRIDLIDRILSEAARDDIVRIAALAQTLASDSGFAARIAAKQVRRAADEIARPLDAYRTDELARMRLNFYGFDPSYHVARYNFIHKIPKSRTPLTLARHRTTRGLRKAS